MLGATSRAISPVLIRHTALTRVGVVAILLAVVAAASLQSPSQAGPVRQPQDPSSILPPNVGIGVRSSASVVVDFGVPMDRSSVEANLSVRPATGWHAIWTPDDRSLELVPASRWQTDARYLVSVHRAARTAAGSELGRAFMVSFTTQTAPAVTAFRVQFPGDVQVQRQRASLTADVSTLEATAMAGPQDTHGDVSTRTMITIGFSTPMSRRNVERHFVISPSVEGVLEWSGNSLVFVPAQPLAPDARYAVTLTGARDRQGNPLRGEASFSFTTRAGAQAVKVTPADGATDITNEAVSIWFSQPMDRQATGEALTVTDVTDGAQVPGRPSWNADGTQLVFVPGAAMAEGHEFTVSFADGARDLDGNAFAESWTFTTQAPPPAPAPAPRPAVGPAPPGPAAPADLAQFALWQVNQSRAQYGFAPLVLDAGVSAVASSHAWDMAQNGYFSHTGLDGSRVSDRLRRGGVSFSSSGENLCYQNGNGVRGMLEWCHSVFMSEPYPGVANHIGNILSPRFSRMGVGIAQIGSRVYIVWNFAG